MLDFEDPESTFSTLQTFYAFGAPLSNKAHALLDGLLCPLIERGLCIEAVTEVYLSTEYSFGGLYLRPLNSEKLSIGALYDIVSKLAGQLQMWRLLHMPASSRLHTVALTTRKAARFLRLQLDTSLAIE